MSIRFLAKLLIAAAMLALTNACASYYQAYGYGWVSKSRIPPELTTPVVLPEAAPSISQRFRPVNLSADGGHKGIDLLVPSATPVLAAGDGVVTRVERSLLYGRQIMVDHAASSAGYRIQTRYYHLSEQLVAAGDAVKRGQLLGHSGASGLAAGYPHLHFEIHRLGDATPAIALNYVDPQLFWVDGIGMITCYDRLREFPVAPLALTYPVPCKGVAWK